MGAYKRIFTFPRKKLILHVFFALQLSALFVLYLFANDIPYLRGLQERRKWRQWIEHVDERDGKNICFATYELRGPDRSGGIGATVHSLALLLANNRFQVTIVYAGRWMGKEEVRLWMAAFDDLGIRFVNLDDIPHAHTLPAIMASFKVYEWLRDHEDECDLVHFHDFVGIGFHSLLAKRMGLALQNTILEIDSHAAHAYAREGSQRFITSVDEMAKEWLERQAVHMGDVIVAPSQYIVDWMKKEWNLAPMNVKIIHNVLPGRVDEAEYAGGPIDEIAFYGKFDPLKGIDIFLDAMDRLSAHYSSAIRLVTIIGSPGSDFSMSYVNERASKWNMPYQIIRSKSPESTMEYFKTHNVVVVYPSRADNSPTVILESAANGICFIASNVGGIPELLSPVSQETHLFDPNGRDLALKLKEMVTSVCKLPILASTLAETRRAQLDWHTQVFNLTLPPKASYDPHSDRPLVSVVITVSDRFVTLPAALDSLQSQTYSHFEIIIVDDGSEADSQRELERMVGQYPLLNIRIVHQERMGRGNARNSGVKMSKGQWIMFLDDSDVSKPHHIETYLKAAVNIGADALTNNIDVYKGDKPWGTYDERYIGFGASIELSFFGNSLGAVSNVFIKKQVFEEVGGFNENANGYEDWEFGVRLLMAHRKVEVVPESLFWKREPPALAKSSDRYKATSSIMEKFLEKIPPELHPILKLARSLNDEKMNEIGFAK